MQWPNRTNTRHGASGVLISLFAALLLSSCGGGSSAPPAITMPPVDPFTMQSREFNYQHTAYFRVGLRHDVTDWGLSYGGVIAFGDARRKFDYDEIALHKEVNFSSLFAEYNLGRGITVRFEANDLTNFDRGRDRRFYADGVASDVVTSRELVKLREGRVYNLSFRGTL